MTPKQQSENTAYVALVAIAVLHHIPCPTKKQAQEIRRMVWEAEHADEPYAKHPLGSFSVDSLAYNLLVWAGKPDLAAELNYGG